MYIVLVLVILEGCIDTEIQRIEHEGLVDVYNSVCRLRFWRSHNYGTISGRTSPLLT